MLTLICLKFPSRLASPRLMGGEIERYQFDEFLIYILSESDF